MSKEVSFKPKINIEPKMSYRTKLALITGVAGQDGSYLAELLLSKNYEVHGLIRRSAIYPESLRNIEHIKDKIHLHFGDLENENHLSHLIYELQPDEIYNLASQSDVRVSFDIPEYTGNVTGLGVTRILEAIRKFSKYSKFYQASSSELYGDSHPPQNEETPFRPRNPYAASKLYGYWITKIYREAYDIFACNGILYNHESPRRGENFVTRKITKGIADIIKNKKKVIKLGNIEAKRDWGFAGDYVEAMYLMMKRNVPDDFVIGTGEAYSVQDFLLEAFNYVNLDWKEYVEIDYDLFRPSETNYLLADPYKANTILNWKPKVKFKELVRMMVDADLKE